ncbi:hypothetical protein [Photobacterium leiognathi]|uniref:hypothetical protein n=1 Tax=Photobacterium leiognathi TaxID=553611 RepID=UPI0029820E52|nr:hypothetical protein [Photobacterium leiognathi]
MKEILESELFVCHKTVNDRVESRRQCAGHMLLAPINSFVSLAQAMGFELSLTGRELLFDDVEQCIEHHKS